ncbi:MAG: hypothetical protein MI725_12645, partial [Pirellulales bacterium]|nr:hypothetical protein [Pirellulales bacterium]
HFLADIDNLDNSPGGIHAFGVSNITGCVGCLAGGGNIPALGKNAGTRLGWGEGLANYISSATHAVGGFNQPNVPTVNDAIYTNRNTVAANQFSVAIENNGTNDGEGDEASIMRILWDIADPTGGGEAHDQIAIGHGDAVTQDGLYNILDNIGGLVRLDQVWDHFFANTGDLKLGAIPVDRKRALLGDIFEEYDVSPDPGGVIIGATLNLAGAAPAFSWARNNENANDEFDLIVFNNDFTSRILEVDVPGNVTSYALSAAQWQTLKNAGVGLRNFVVVGADTTTFATGPYWSGSEQFTLIPEPATRALMILAIVTIGLAPCRRRT